MVYADGVARVKVASRCGVKPLTSVMRESRVRWYGHVRRWQGGVLGEVMEMDVPGTRPRPRPKKR